MKSSAKRPIILLILLVFPVLFVWAGDGDTNREYTGNWRIQLKPSTQQGFMSFEVDSRLRGRLDLLIQNNSGEVVHERSMKLVKGKKTGKIPTDSLAPGVYEMEFKAHGETEWETLIVGR